MLTLENTNNEQIIQSEETLKISANPRNSIERVALRSLANCDVTCVDPKSIITTQASLDQENVAFEAKIPTPTKNLRRRSSSSSVIPQNVEQTEEDANRNSSCTTPLISQSPEGRLQLVVERNLVISICSGIGAPRGRHEKR